MIPHAKHIILLGFKHVGKSVIGHALAMHLQRHFIDLDRYIENLFLEEYKNNLSCREMMQQYGEAFFRTLETRALKKIIPLEPVVLSLGGGTPLAKENQKIMHSQILIHITAPKNIVFERIMAQGRPAFFPAEQNPLQAFNQLWEEREPIYQQLTKISVDNTQSLSWAVNEIVMLLKEDNG